MAVAAPFSRRDIALIWTTTEKHSVLDFYQLSGCPQLLALKAHRVSPAWQLAWAQEEGWRRAVQRGSGLEKQGGDWGEVWFPLFFPMPLEKSNFVIMMELSQN